jgi:hypothetical protein
MRIEALTVELKRQRLIAPGVELAKKSKDKEVRWRRRESFFMALIRDSNFNRAPFEEDEEVRTVYHNAFMARHGKRALAKLEEEQKKN